MDNFTTGEQVVVEKLGQYYRGIVEKVSPSGQVTVKFGGTSQKFTPKGRQIGAGSVWSSMRLCKMDEGYAKCLRESEDKRRIQRLRETVRCQALLCNDAEALAKALDVLKAATGESRG